MGLVNSNKGKRGLVRGPSIEPQNKFTIEQLEVTNVNDNVNADIPVTYEPKPTTLKIDTKIRDQINTLALIGYGETQKETIELLINNILDSMTSDEKRKFDYQYQVLEDKTIKLNNKKK